MSTTPSTGEISFAPVSSKPAIADIKDQMRKLPGMVQNAICTVLVRKEDMVEMLIVCGPLDAKADFEATCDAADKILDAAGLNISIRAFQDLRGTHIVIDAASQE